MSDFLDELKRRRAEALERRHLADREIEAIDLLLARAAGGDVPNVSGLRQEVATGMNGAKARRQPGEAKKRRREIVEACRRHLRAAKAPIRRVDLLGLVQADGIEIPSGNPRVYLSSLLWNHKDEIVNFYEQGYWLADRPFPPLAFKGLKDEQHPLILTRQTGLRALRDRIVQDGGDPDAELSPPDDEPAL